MTPVLERLEALSRPERFDALELIVVTEFKTALLMTEDEDLPLEDSFFELGLTSLGLVDVKQRLETLFGRGIDSTVFFNSPTIEQLMDRFTTEILADLFEVGGPDRTGGAAGVRPGPRDDSPAAPGGAGNDSASAA
jgi:acyl carrier protein